MSHAEHGIFTRPEPLRDLHAGQNFGDKLAVVHDAIRQQLPYIDRISVILHDPKTGLLKSFIKSGSDDPVSLYSCPIEDAPSLCEMRDRGTPRLVNDLHLFDAGTHRHTHLIAASGYRSSYAVPLFYGGELLAVVFFNSRRRGAFTTMHLPLLNLYAHLINSLVIAKLVSVRTLLGAFRCALNMVGQRDPETGNHLERMSRYARLIALELSADPAVPCRLSDEEVEHLFLFSPLHDLGKIGIPDSILLKTGKLDDAEWAVMKTHAERGLEIVKAILEHLGSDTFEHTGVLGAVTRAHHETLDGRGYPLGLKGKEVPIEAMIVAVADIFDALTSRRSYKEPWSNDDAFAELHRLAGTKLDPDCVRALDRNRSSVEEIQEQFADA